MLRSRVWPVATKVDSGDKEHAITVESFVRTGLMLRRISERNRRKTETGRQYVEKLAVWSQGNPHPTWLKGAWGLFLIETGPSKR